MIFALMIIYFGGGKYAQFDTERYNNMTECLAARRIIIEEYKESWTPIPEDKIVCKEVRL